MGLQHRLFLVNNGELLRGPILKKISEQPRLYWVIPEVESLSADLLQAGRCNLVFVDDWIITIGMDPKYQVIVILKNIFEK